MTRPLLVAVSAISPYPVTNGYNLRVSSLLERLAAEWNIILLSPPQSVEAEWSLKQELVDWRQVAIREREAFIEPAPRDESLTMAEAFLEILTRYRPGACLLWSGTESVANCHFDLPGTVWDRIDTRTLHQWRSLSERKTFYDRIWAIRSTVHRARAERQALHWVNAVTVVAEADARVLRALALGLSKRIHVVPNGVVLRSNDYGAGTSETPTIVFTGVLSFPPNALAARHFVQRVWPSVHRSVPAAQFIVAGHDPWREVLDLERVDGVSVRADVPDMASLLREAWVVVAPMISGSGMKNKVLEAWAVGRPVVMYKLATGGLNVAEVCPDLVVDGPAEMAATVCRLLEDPELRARYGDTVHAAAGRRSWDTSARQMSELLHAVASH